MYNSILLAVDLAHESSWKKAAPTARKLAESFGADLHVCTVILDTRRGMVSQYFPADFEQKAAENAANKLAIFCKTELAGVAVKQHVVVGRVYRAIVETAKREGCDLIVMASHRPELTDIVIGPNADSVLRATSASVLIVRD